MAFDVTQMGKLVDEMWRDTVQETDEFEATFWQMCQKMKGKATNTRGEKWKVRTGYNESESWASSDGSAYAQPGNSSFQNLYVPYRHVSTQMTVTQEAIDNDNGQSHYHPVADELASTLRAGFKKINRHALMGNGTGRIAVLTAAYSGGSPTVLTCAPGTDFGNKGAQFVKPGKKVQVYDPTGATLRNGTIGGEGIITVSSKVNSTGAITFTSNAPSDAADDDIIVPERSAALAPHGLPYWVANSGNLFDLSRATYTGLKSTMIDGSSGAVLMLVETLTASMAFYVGEAVAYGEGDNKGKDILMWSPTQRQRYRQEAIGTGITMLGEDKIDMGFGYTETINGIKTVTSADHDNTKIHRLRMSDWYRLSVNGASEPFEKRKIHGTDMYNLYDSSSRVASAYGIVLDGYINFACENPRNQAAIYGLPTSGLITGNE